MPQLCPVTGDLVVDVLTLLPPTALRTKVLTHGYMNILDVMPRLVPANTGNCDFAIADAARRSYQNGTRKVNDDAALVDRLIRNMHTSPVEMVEFKFECRMPIFVARQMIRHRTASVNEESARYSELAADFYVPNPADWAINKATDKQSTDKLEVSSYVAEQLHAKITEHNHSAYCLYMELLRGENNDSELLNIPGIAREQARMVLGVNIYTSWVWKIDLKNLLHFLSLRLDSHAQYEIRVYAEAMRAIVSALCPAAWASHDDNFVRGVNFSASELSIIQGALNGQTASVSLSISRKAEFRAKLKKAGLLDTVEKYLK